MDYINPHFLDYMVLHFLIHFDYRLFVAQNVNYTIRSIVVTVSRINPGSKNNIGFVTIKRVTTQLVSWEESWVKKTIKKKITKSVHQQSLFSHKERGLLEPQGYSYAIFLSFGHTNILTSIGLSEVYFLLSLSQCHRFNLCNLSSKFFSY